MTEDCETIMKIVHITLHYRDGWGYQDNLLPLYQQKAGNDVVVISDINHLPERDRVSILAKGRKYYDGNLKIYRINCYGNTGNTSLFCSGLYKILKEEKPDLIFHHGVNSSTLVVSCVYKKRNRNTILFVDSHTDYINMSKNKIWRICYEKVWLSLVCKLITLLVDKYYGVSILRREYLHQTYRIPVNKTGFLPLGGDTDMVESIIGNRAFLRNEFSIPEDDFVIVSGGKMGVSKGTISLIDAYIDIRKDNANCTLVLFGEMDSTVEDAVKGKDGIISIGWCDRKKTISLLKISDVAVWPLLHTTLIEDAIACGIPLIVKKSGNVAHYEKEECGIFLKHGDANEIKDALYKIRDTKYKENAQKASRKYSYHSIVKVINDDYISYSSLSQQTLKETRQPYEE